MILSLIGLISGIVSGMGIGGGTILIPSLVLFTSLTQQQAQGINLIVFIPTAAVALYIHFKNKNLVLSITIQILLAGFIGSIIGSKLAVNMSSSVLRKVFGVFLFFMGIYEFFSKKHKK